MPHRPGAVGDYAVCIGDGQPRRLDHAPPHAAALGYLPGTGPFVHAFGGPCPGRLWVTFADLPRGLSSTPLIGEKAIGKPGEGPLDNCIYNADHWQTVGRHYPDGFAGPHPGVVLFVYADGSARPVGR